jgi:cytochrome P450
MSTESLPIATPQTGLVVLREMARSHWSPLAALAVMRAKVGPIFQINLPGFHPAVYTGPEANRAILVTDREQLSWRNETDPVVQLLRRGVLVVDGAEHDKVRGLMDPPLHRRNVLPHIPAFWQYTDQVTAAWQAGETRDMLVEMRKLALLILVGATFKVDFAPDMARMWQPILDLIEYISPGLWIIWPGAPAKAKHKRAAQAMDDYLYTIIRRRREELAASGAEPDDGDLLGKLIAAPEMTDDLIRDQLLTMLIAGHDTSTALLSWVFYLLGVHDEARQAVIAEVDAVIGASDAPPTVEQINRLDFLDQVIKETLRLYPPIHVGNRRMPQEQGLCGYRVGEGTRVMYSIYLSHRDHEHWREPDAFCPERFARGSEEKVPPFTYVPFGGGPRNCIGAAFAQVEARTVLARLFQRFHFELIDGDRVHAHMGATLEPRPGVKMRVTPRRG